MNKAALLGHLRPLIAEDSPRDAEFLQIMLEQAGYDVALQRVDTVEDFSTALAEGSWDLVLCDNSMPGFNALAALKLLQTRDLDLPFIIVSGTIGEGAAVSAMKAGAHDYIMKDNLARLIPAIERELREADERRRRRALERERARLAAIVESSDDAIIGKTLDGIITSWNRGAEKLYGYSAGDVIGRPIDVLVPADRPDEVPDILRRLKRGGLVVHHETVRVRKDGTLVDVSVTISPVIDGAGTVLGASSIARDISERKQMERLQARQAHHAMLGAEVGAILTRGGGIHDGLQQCAQAMVCHLDAAFARIWTLNCEESVLELQASAGMYTHLDGPHARVPVGHLTIGLIAQEREPHLTNAVIGDPGVQDQEWAKREGMVAFAGYPLVVEDQAVGVMAIFARQPFPDDTLRALGAIADSIALGIQRQRAEHAVQEREERLSRIVETDADGIILQDLNDRFTFVNSAAEKMFALPRSEIVGRTSEELGWKLFALDGSPLPPEDHPSARTAVTAYPIYDAEYVLERHDGRRLIVSSNSAPLHGTDGSIIGAVNSIVDITERKRNEQALLRSEEEFRLLFANNPLPMWVYDPHTLRFLEVNAAAVDHYGYSRDEFLQMCITDIRPPEDIPQLLESVTAIRNTLQRSGEWRHQLKDERIIYVDIRSHVLEFAGRKAVLVLALDITERRTFEEQLKHQVLHDTLTGLPNRALLKDRLEQAIHQAERHVKKTALILMDLDRFKEINDTLGHHYGDILLQQLSLRLLKTLRASDTVARLGGDEFAMVLPETEYGGALRAISSIQTALKAPFLVEGESFGISASFGIALYSDHGEDADTLLRRADVAMYVAKRDHSGYALYEPCQDEHSLRRLTVTSELARAIDEEQLFVQYQPEYTVRSGSIDHVEALVRWQHPVRGPIAPGEFIPWAEETGLIRHLTLWVLRTAIEQCRVWHDAGRSLGVAVNFSTRNLLDRSLVATIAELLRTSDVCPRQLTVEITESALMADPARAREILTELHDMGARISIDDFGTGYSSLASLARMPLNEIKIDRTFIVDMNGTIGDPFIVRSIIDLGHHRGLEVVAEGVEDAKTYQALVDLGCDTIQGYHIARPLAATDVLHWLPPAGALMAQESRSR